ncbi:MAG: LLM class flavin-dependent oxidoreductase, partial [Chloroflexota bacterium]|nr:LLM class flavin-dependent oxidoreductase [Chloroflexota bacterium]
FTNASPPDKAALDLWPSLTYAADHTNRIQFGSLVTPVTFRLPPVTAKAAAAVDDLSGGRLVLGIGAGWQKREHHNFGIPFPLAETRYGMLRDYLEVVTRLFHADEPVSYDGEYFSLHETILLPRPERPGGPTILVGGNGRERTMPLAARYADEWNALFVTPNELRGLQRHFDALLRENGRPEQAVRRSIMLGTLFARDERVLQEKLAERGRSLEEIRERGLIAGTPEMWVEQIGAYASAGAERIMLQWLDQDDIEGLEIVAGKVLAAL